MKALGLGGGNEQVRFADPFGFFDFITLQRNAFCVLSDSGTVQEECAIFRVPNITIRDVTERPETLECGSGSLSGAEPELLSALVRLVTESDNNWQPPTEYMKPNVADTVIRIVTGFLLR
jgi:UDP-N-acetylglucosamine 2-epimerase (non-hydrolysing)